MTDYEYEYRMTYVQFIDGASDESMSPTAPRGEGWVLKHVAAASGRTAKPSGSMPMCALIFYVWERKVPQ